MIEQDQPLILQINVTPDSHVSVEELDIITRSLLAEITRDIQVESAGLKSSLSPSNTRAAEAITIGVMTLALLPVVLGKLIDLLNSWMQRNHDKKITIVVPSGNKQVTIEYDPSASTKDEISQLIRETVGLARRAK